MDSEIVSLHSNINTVTLDLTIDMFNRYLILSFDLTKHKSTFNNNIIFIQQTRYSEYRKFCFGKVIDFRIYRIMDCSSEVGVFKDGFFEGGTW